MRELARCPLFVVGGRITKTVSVFHAIGITRERRQNRLFAACRAMMDARSHRVQSLRETHVRFGGCKPEMAAALRLSIPVSRETNGFLREMEHLFRAA
jgi:hypothetical protein